MTRGASSCMVLHHPSSIEQEGVAVVPTTTTAAAVVGNRMDSSTSSNFPPEQLPQQLPQQQSSSQSAASLSAASASSSTASSTTTVEKNSRVRGENCNHNRHDDQNNDVDDLIDDADDNDTAGNDATMSNSSNTCQHAASPAAASETAVPGFSSASSSALTSEVAASAPAAPAVPAVAVSATATLATPATADHHPPPHVTEETESKNEQDRDHDGDNNDNSSDEYSSSYSDDSCCSDYTSSSSMMDYDHDDNVNNNNSNHTDPQQQQRRHSQEQAAQGERQQPAMPSVGVVPRSGTTSSSRIPPQLPPPTPAATTPAATPSFRIQNPPHPFPPPQQQQQAQVVAAATVVAASSSPPAAAPVDASSSSPAATADAATVTAAAVAAVAPPTAVALACATTTNVASTNPQQQHESLIARRADDTGVGGSGRAVINDEDHDNGNDNDGDDADFELALVWQRNKRVLLGRLEESIPRGRLSLINLSRRGLGLQEAILLKHAIQSNQQLSVLKLGYNDLRDEGVVIIAQAIQCCCPLDRSSNIKKNNTARVSNQQHEQHHANLTVLDLGFNNVGNAGVEALAVHALAGNYTLETLYLSGNVIGPKGAFSIAAAILHGTGLCSLHLAGNQIGAVGIKAIAGAIAESDCRLAAVAAAKAAVMASNCTNGGSVVIGGIDGDSSKAKSMVELHVGNANIGSGGFLAIPGMLLSNITLRSLSVTNNGIDDQAMLLLSQALSQNKNVPLETMQFSFNEITDQGVECLMNAVWGSKFLRVLKLDNNKIQDRGAQLCAVVLTSIPLRVLDLSFNRVTTTGIKALMRNISENDSLHTLGMSGIPIDQHASKAVSFALAYNSSLNVLYLDNCSAGYSAQRHIVAGVVSNRRASLRVLTGFSLAPITMTLGMPRIPEEWSNEQVLGFVRLMWQQWLVKSGHGNVEETQSIRGPAPPTAVAAAAKIAFSSLGMSPQKLFQTETHDKPLSEGAPVDSASSALLERTPSGTLGVPPFSEQYAGQILDWVDADSKSRSTTTMASPPAVSVPSLDDPEQRNRNLQWLRTHFRSLSEVGRLPFNNADLWQLHQYYFSPPVYPSDDSSDKSMSETEGSVAAQSSQDDAVAPPPTPAVKASNNPTVGRAISFHALGDALAAQGLVGSASKNNKRRSSQGVEEDNGPASKRAKNLKPRIAYYPRLMAKIQSLGTRPMDQTLSLLRQLKYTENLMFAGLDPYGESVAPGRVHRDIEMILVDLL